MSAENQSVENATVCVSKLDAAWFCHWCCLLWEKGNKIMLKSYYITFNCVKIRYGQLSDHLAADLSILIKTYCTQPVNRISFKIIQIQRKLLPAFFIEIDHDVINDPGVFLRIRSISMINLEH